MTQSEAPQIGAAAQLISTPDGKLHVAVVITCGGVQAMAALPADGADAFVDQLAKSVRLASAEARRRNSGLIIPGHQVPVPGNGRPQFVPPPG